MSKLELYDRIIEHFHFDQFDEMTIKIKQMGIQSFSQRLMDDENLKSCEKWLISCRALG